MNKIKNVLQAIGIMALLVGYPLLVEAAAHYLF